MKKYLSLVLVGCLLFGLISCKKMPDSEHSSADISVIESTVYSEPAVTENQSEPEPESRPESEPQPTITVLQSTIATPDYVYFYNGGKYGTSTDKKQNREIARNIEAWFKDFNTLPVAKLTVDYDLITDITCNEKVVELCFNNSGINLLGKFNLEKANRLLIPLTGEYKNCVFVCYYNKAKGSAYLVSGSGLEKYFKGITFDKKAQDWQSTVIAPTTVTFYKDGMQSVSTDKELNLKIAQHIEAWYKYQTTLASCNCITTDKNIMVMKHNQTAVELIFDDEIKFYGGFLGSDERKIVVPITGDKAYHIFTSDLYSGYWGNTMTLSKCDGLEPFFEGRQFEEIPMDEWKSTVVPPYMVQLYRNGELLEESTDNETNHKIAQHIESWYLYEDSIKSTVLKESEDIIKNIRKNETYVEIIFHSEIKFYDKNMLSPETYCLLIPLTGDYAYCMFEAGDDYNYNRVSIDEDSAGLEQFFKSLTVDNNNQ